MVFFSLLPYTTIFDAIAPRSQNALLRRMRFFSPGQTRRRLTERRTLAPVSHGKAHSGSLALTEKRILRWRCDGKVHSVLGVSRKDALWLQTLTGSITMVRGNLPEAGSRDGIAKVTMAAVLDGLVKVA